MSYQTIFERYEKKYLLSETQYKILRGCLIGRLQEDRFGKSLICNVYYDTPDHRMIRSSLEKPMYKEKLRLRSYGIPGRKSEVFAEVKKKYQGVVYKRRAAMRLEDARPWLEGTAPAPLSSQITREIDWLLSFYGNLAPAMYLCYDRVALAGLEDPSLRVTFDSRILWRQENPSLESGSWGSPLLSPGQRLMEIKIPGAMPLWLCHILDELRVYPTTFSKYGNGYLASLQDGKGVEICA